MDGENNGKFLINMDDLGGKPTIFGNIHIQLITRDLLRFGVLGMFLGSFHTSNPKGVWKPGVLVNMYVYTPIQLPTHPLESHPIFQETYPAWSYQPTLQAERRIATTRDLVGLNHQQYLKRWQTIYISNITTNPKGFFNFVRYGLRLRFQPFWKLVRMAKIFAIFRVKNKTYIEQPPSLIFCVYLESQVPYF